MKLVLHSYTFRRYSLPHVFAVASRYGWEAIEMVHFHFDPARVEDEVADAVALGRRYGVELHCVGYTGDWVGDDPDACEASLALAERTIVACARNGIGMVNGWSGTLEEDPNDWRRNGSILARDRHYERAAAGYRRLGDLARDHGVTVGVEVYPGSVHDTVATNAKLLAMVDHPQVVATADPGNAYIISEADRDAGVLDLLDGKLGYFHLKNLYPDVGKADFNVDTADGVLDNYAFVTRAHAMGVPAMAVEYCGDGDPHPPIARAQDYIRSCLALADDLRQRHEKADAAKADAAQAGSAQAESAQAGSAQAGPAVAGASGPVAGGAR